MGWRGRCVCLTPARVLTPCHHPSLSACLSLTVRACGPCRRARCRPAGCGRASSGSEKNESYKKKRGEGRVSEGGERGCLGCFCFSSGTARRGGGECCHAWVTPPRNGLTGRLARRGLLRAGRALKRPRRPGAPFQMGEGPRPHAFLCPHTHTLSLPRRRLTVPRLMRMEPSCVCVSGVCIERVRVRARAPEAAARRGAGGSRPWAPARIS